MECQEKKANCIGSTFHELYVLFIMLKNFNKLFDEVKQVLHKLMDKKVFLFASVLFRVAELRKFSSEKIVCSNILVELEPQELEFVSVRLEAGALHLFKRYGNNVFQCTF